MRQFDFEVIKNVPYSAIVYVPPDYFHQSTFFKIAYIESGNVDIEFVSRKTNERMIKNCSIGDAFIVSPKDIHKYKVNLNSETYRHRDLYISSETMKICCDIIVPDLYDELDNSEYPCFFRVSQNEILSLGEKLSVFINRKKREERLDEIHRALVVSLLGQYCLCKAEKHLYPAWIQDLLRNLDKKEYLMRSVEEIISLTNYSYSHVAKMFKKYMGVSLRSYITDKKLAFSAVMLVNGDISVEDIAFALKFQYVSNYIRAFKRKYGVSPGRYQKEEKAKQTSIPFVDWGGGLNSPQIEDRK